MTDISKEELVLVDGSGYIFRAYYALPPMYRSDGLPVNAVFGFCNMLLKLVEDIQAEKGGNIEIAVIFDAARETFRNQIYSEYKANRSDPPDDLKPQFDIIKKVPEHFNLKSIEYKGFEADDLIASYSKIAIEKNKKVTIVSSDKDLMQLIDKNILMFDPLKKKEIGRESVFEKFGVYPEKVIDVQALAGDSSDNIPGVPGIGPKIAAQLINDFDNLENLIENTHKIKQEKRRLSLEENKDLAFISKQLVTLRQDVKLPVSLDKLKFRPLDVNKLLNFLDEMEFNKVKANVISKFGNGSNKDFGKNKRDLNLSETKEFRTPIRNRINKNNYELITNLNALEVWCNLANEKGVLAIDCETTSTNPVEAEIVGFSMSFENSKACYIPLKHKERKDDQLELDEFIPRVKIILEDESILKVGQNIKYDFIILKALGITLKNMDDTMLMSYVLRTGFRGHNLDELAMDFLSHETIKFSDVTTFNKKKILFSEVDLDKALLYSAEDSDITFRLWEILKLELIKSKLYYFYFYVERPLIEIVGMMEINGCKVNNRHLEKISKVFLKKIEILESDVFKLVGEKFNIGSPKQLGEILFTKLELPHGKKGKSGNFQTDVKILEKLKSEKYEVASLVLDWRHLSKLRNTYCEGLLSRENKKTKRIHTSFGMASTLTGRFSSNDPNLQNIPIKTNEGREIRKAFVPAPNHKIVSIDYSQIELRILAHVANVKSLLNAFSNDEDIHSVTAMEVFQVNKESLNNDLRRKAKIINFGIIYGISPYGLALQLEISNSEAKSYIENYFLKYPGIKEYMKNTIDLCRGKGHVFTPFGRRIYIPFINDKIASRRNFAERSAINAPIQGGAADLIKIIMPKIYNFLKTEGLKTKMLIQVHDELIFEVPENEIDFIKLEIPKIMVGSHQSLLELNVPIKVDVGEGLNWDEAH
ncbi:MAG: DNA polymerase I [Alphaproteobacteria bacterium]|nr:DNA polymerase I [Alphaproteobacteria bacterium]